MEYSKIEALFNQENELGNVLVDHPSVLEEIKAAIEEELGKIQSVEDKNKLISDAYEASGFSEHPEIPNYTIKVEGIESPIDIWITQSFMEEVFPSLSGIYLYDNDNGHWYEYVDWDLFDDDTPEHIIENWYVNGLDRSGKPRESDYAVLGHAYQ